MITSSNLKDSSTAVPVKDRASRTLGLRASVLRWESVLVLLLAFVFVFGSMGSPFFLSANNIGNSVGFFAEKAIVAIALTLVVIAGDIDLSVASTMTLSAVVLGIAAESQPFGIAIVLALAVGAACGMVNALLVVGLQLPSLVVTLGTLALFRGIANGLIQDETRANFPAWFTDFGFGSIPGSEVPWSVAVFVALLVPAAVWLHATSGGRRLYALGSNPTVAHMAGVRVARTRVLLFVLSGTAAAIAGVLLAGRFAVVRADLAFGFELDIITAVLLGGVSIFGGRGSLVGVFVACAILAILRSALALANVPGDLQNLVVGSLLVGSVLATNAVPHLRRWIRRPMLKEVPANN
jgi:rhamnose transport system permease protein